MKILEVFWTKDGRPAQGSCEEGGQRYVFEREEGNEVLFYEMAYHEWDTIDAEPRTPQDFADLQALHLLMRARGPCHTGVMRADGSLERKTP